MVAMSLGKNAIATDLVNAENLVVVGSSKETTYIHPKSLYDYLADNRLKEFKLGVVSFCKVGGIEVAVSAPHVTNTPGWTHKLPLSTMIGEWLPSKDGREISFARVTKPNNLGITAQIVEAAEAKNGPATLKVSNFSPMVRDVVSFELSGQLEKIESPEHLAAITQFLKSVNEKSALFDRVTKRAPNKMLLAMTMNYEFRNQGPGLSGSLIWQENKPVGVFVAMLIVGDMPPLAVFEPLLEPAKETIPLLK